MLSEQLNPNEQQLVTTICAELDGVPFAEKAPVIAASLEAMRKGNPVAFGGTKFSPVGPQPARPPVLRVA